MPPSENLNFNQIPHYIHSLWLDCSKVLRLMPYEKLCTQDPGQKGGVSKMYRLLLDTPNKLSNMVQ